MDKLSQGLLQLTAVDKVKVRGYMGNALRERYNQFFRSKESFKPDWTPDSGAENRRETIMKFLKRVTPIKC